MSPATTESTALPEIFLLDANGVYRAVIRGAAPLDEILAVLSIIE